MITAPQMVRPCYCVTQSWLEEDNGQAHVLSIISPGACAGRLPVLHLTIHRSTPCTSSGSTTQGTRPPQVMCLQRMHSLSSSRHGHGPHLPGNIIISMASKYLVKLRDRRFPRQILRAWTGLEQDLVQATPQTCVECISTCSKPCHGLVWPDVPPSPAVGLASRTGGCSTFGFSHPSKAQDRTDDHADKLGIQVASCGRARPPAAVALAKARPAASAL